MQMDNQIQEMAKDMCEYYYEGTCYQDKKPCDLRCESMTDAQYLYAKGYRKASEVASGIFEEIEKSIATIKYTVDSPRYTHIPVETMVEVCNWILQDCIPKRLAELKKKYTESEKDK